MKPLAEHSTLILYNSFRDLSLLKPLYGTVKNKQVVISCVTVEVSEN